MSHAVLERPAAQQALSPEDQFERYDTIDTPKIVVIGFIAAIVTFAAIVGAQALYFAFYIAESEVKEVRAADTLVDDALTKQRAKLSSYGWVDPQQGIVTIPVDDAMKLVLEEENSRKTRNENSIN
ncbi:MAG: hypothetical protein ACF8TS_13175 [Maioricimonas sp. JB049]